MPTISGDIATLQGSDHTPGDPVALYVECSQPILVDGTTGRTGGKLPIPVAADGTFTVTGLPASVGDIPLYRLQLDSRTLRLQGLRAGITSGWFPLTTDRDLTWIVANYVPVTAITATIASNVAAAAALGATNDTATASFVNSASATRTALDARYPTTTSLSGSYGTELKATLNDSTFDTLLASLPAGARVFIPEGVTITLGAGHTLPKKVYIDGPGRILDSRAAPTTALLTIGPAASGSRIACPIDGSVVGTYLDFHNAIQIAGTDGGAGVAPTYVSDVVIDCPRISGFGRFAVWGEFASNVDISIGDAYNLGHGGVIVRSGIGVNTTVRRLHDVAPGPGVGAETYGVQYDRRDSNNDLVRYPHSRECSARIDVARNAPMMNMLGTHGGQGLDFSFGAAYGVKRVIDIVPATGSTSATQFAPNHISFTGGYANSGKTDGTMDSAVIIAGAYNSGTNTVIEHAKNVSGHINTIIGYGIQSDNISGAVYCRTTQGLALSFGTFREPSPRAVHLYHTNKDFTVSIGTVIDAWSTANVSSFVGSTGINNRGTVVSLRGTRGAKSATSVNARGVDVFSDATNKVVLGPSTNLVATTVTAVSGPVTGWTTYIDDQVALFIAGALRARFYDGGASLEPGQKFEMAASAAAAASMRLPHGAAPTTPVNGDMWTTSSGLFVRINGVTRQVTVT